MKYELATKYVLHGLHINRRYSGYNYIMYAIHLMEKDIFCIDCITKSLYVDIARKYKTSWKCVERNIRTVVEAVWDDTEIDRELWIGIFGSNGIIRKPTNKEFLEYLFEYIELYIYYDRTKKCDITEKECILYPKCRVFQGKCILK
ncbi:MAG: sporulation initiation factor Spo0A C-terminal domain-containing protein [Lachnospiraceae bacterium]|nr:sporulation initiation factor Spo0A C-terminal domain-containing protein [Lachnospiraceae bacterium]